MRLRIVLAAILTTGVALLSAGCVSEHHDDHDRHARGYYHDERGGRYGGWDRHDRHCD